MKRRRKRAQQAPDPGDLLAWYARLGRKLPWRAPSGERPDPYRVWLSEIMLQQTTVTTVAPYFLRFVARWPNVEALAAASLDDVLRQWAGLGYYARARNLHACARLVRERHGGKFPQSETGLAELPGIGAYTAAAIAAIAFGARAAAVDGNVERVVARLFAIAEPLPGAKPTLRRLAQTLIPAERAGDFAQALMDLGATICTPKRPTCMVCPWATTCMTCREGTAELFPVKQPRKVGALRRGAAFVLTRTDGCLLVRTRARSGLLGGMTEVPTTVWAADFQVAHALAQAPQPRQTQPRWQRLAGVVTHQFTHFPLELAVYTATVSGNSEAPRDHRWLAPPELFAEAWPNLMRKVLAHAGLIASRAAADVRHDPRRSAT